MCTAIRWQVGSDSISITYETYVAVRGHDYNQWQMKWRWYACDMLWYAGGVLVVSLRNAGSLLSACGVLVI